MVDEHPPAIEPQELRPGTLYVVPTPIGNLGDLSPRARALFAHVDLLACEDTRETRRLLAALHLPFRGELMSCHDHNEVQRAPAIVERLQGGQTVALVSDAGTPTCSDPGFRVVAAVAAAGLRIVPLPGPVAFMTALSGSGLPSDRVLFVGFLPHKGAHRRTVLEGLAAQTATLALYVSPHRVLDVLADAIVVLGDRQACVARELTKFHEELLRGPLSELRDLLAERDAILGEIVLLVEGAPEAVPTTDLDEARRLVASMTRAGVPARAIKTVVAEHCGISKNDAYALALELGEGR